MGVGELGPLHPRRWRPFTWLIVGYNTFLVGVIAVVAVAEKLNPSTEATGPGAFFLVAFLAVLGGNLWLAIVWGITGAIAARRRPEGQPVRRHVWLWAPLGLTAGVTVGLLLTR